ncbi:MAG: hypothetical protein H6706_15210 [Myxococcales bacterium]|nr:hypothetical protein [Myxococcales bacterium]
MRRLLARVRPLVGGLVLPACLLAAPAALAQAPDGKARELLARFDGEPTVNQVQRAALDYAAMHPELFDNMRTRTRTRALLPDLSVQVTKDLDDESRSVTSFTLDSNNTTRAEKVSATETKDDGLQVRGEVRWKLGDLVFNSQETAVARENRYSAKERQKLLQTVTQVYFERRRAQLDLLLSPPAEAGARALAELKIAQLTGELDALTGGRFSRLVAGEK